MIQTSGICLTQSGDTDSPTSKFRYAARGKSQPTKDSDTV